MSASSHPLHPYDRFERAVERRLGADMRLLYGMGVPVVGASAVIGILLAVSPTMPVMAGLVLLDVVLTVVVMLGFVGLLSEDGDTDETLR